MEVRSRNLPSGRHKARFMRARSPDKGIFITLQQKVIRKKRSVPQFFVAATSGHTWKESLDVQTLDQLNHDRYGLSGPEMDNQ